MAINPVQPNIDNSKPYNTYRDASKPIITVDLTKPLPAEGHLVHDTVTSIPKYWVKDFMYDMKAIKDGFEGKANDHQIGRLNDTGLKMAGIGIAGYLASLTSDPKTRLMEYIGLGAFLTAMNLYPKIAINAPSRIIQGYDIGKEYIDDQGRKKSVFQDPNYIPFDMYRGEYPGESLDIIGDRMGIPRDIKNRDALIQEQMRKIAIQNNTLWMLTAGIATPVMAALMCYGFEKIVPPAMEKAGNTKYNSLISKMLTSTQNMNLNPEEIKSNDLSTRIEKILKNYEGKELPQAELNNIIKIISEETDANLSEGIKNDLNNIFKSAKAGYSIDEQTAKNIAESIRDNIPNRNKQVLEKIFIPSTEEIQNIINRISGSNTTEISDNELKQIREELKYLFESKINQENTVSKDFLNAYKNDILEKISINIKKSPAHVVDEQKIKDVTNFAKILGEFKHNEKALDKCKLFKFEETQTSVLAQSYNKFENTLFEVLNIKYKDLKNIRTSETFAKEVLEQKIEELVKDEAKYEKAISKLSKVVSEMETSLHGNSQDASYIADLISSIENNYNNTAKRLNNAGNGKFSETINKLVKEDVSTLSNTAVNREDIFKFLDGTTSPKPGLGWIDYAKENAKGVGSSKNLEISRILDRYQGVKNSFNRIIHTMDTFKKGSESGYWGDVVKNGKDILLTADSAQHYVKFNTVNSPEFYKDVMNKIWSENIDESTSKAISESDKNNGKILERFQGYIKRFREVMGNNSVDFTKPNHNLGNNINDIYTPQSLTRSAKFNLVAQSPVDFIKKAANRQYGTQKWIRKAAAIFGAVLGGAILVQFAFGKIKNPQNIQKQVSHDTNN